MNDIDIKEYFDMRLDEMEKRLNERFASQQIALELALKERHWAMGIVITVIATTISSIMAYFALRFK